MKNKKKIILLISIVIILITIIIAFFVKGNIFTKVENKNVSEKNKTKEELDSKISNKKTIEVQEEQKTDVKETEETKTVEETKENTTTPSTNTTTNNKTTSQNQPVIQEQPKTYTCWMDYEIRYTYYFNSENECEELGYYSNATKFAFDSSLDVANASIPEKWKKYFYFKYIEREAYYTYIVTDNEDGTKSVTYTPVLGTMKKPGMLLDVIGTFESFKPDWENKPAGSYETYRVKHYQVAPQFIQI
ncbi:MAG: hypothetical protein PHQ89_04515 [Bacilli bacterium]|nr:hypothetical protein [Bacilli bacterium]